MDRRVNTKLQHLDGVGGRWEVPRADYTTWHVGGPATCLIRPLHLAGLQRAVQVLNTHTYPFFVLGRGSNVLVSDAGVHAAAGARAHDIAALIQVAREKVFERFQVKLELEIQLLMTS